MTEAAVSIELRRFILESFLPGEDPATLADSTPLVSSGILTSLCLVEITTFIEESFSVELRPADIGIEQMDSIDLMVDLVRRRGGLREG
ncbi:MAG: acyl carrier protein [Deltaproteobacteria bacterium]